MENFETEFDDNIFFDNFYATISETETSEEIADTTEHVKEVVCYDRFEVSEKDMLGNIEQIFQKEQLNEHLGTVNLLGDLGYSEMLIYYCAVMDYFSIKESNTSNIEEEKLATPEQYVEQKDKDEKVLSEFRLGCKAYKFLKIKKFIDYILNREFKMWSNTYVLDGTDFILFIVFKSVTGYAIRMQLVVKCDDEDTAERIKDEFCTV
ncbi:MAG: hypothetical protein LIO65_03730 [Odoribacter sp.]|nr:hypothetical protein [Odoribacter sp.]